MESNAITVALIHFKCHCFKMPSAGSASGHTRCKSAQLGWLQWDYSDLNQLQNHSFLCAQPSFSIGRGEKRASAAEPRKFFAGSPTVIICESSSLLLPTIRTTGPTRARLPAPLPKPLPKRSLMAQQGNPLAGTDHC